MLENELHKPTCRVLDILEKLASQDGGIGISALATAISTSKSTIFPVVKTLVDRRYVRVDPQTMQYFLGIGSVALAEAGNNQSPWLSAVNDEMKKIVAGCDEVCQLGILDGPNVLYIAKVQSKRQVQLISSVGKRLPAGNTALGKVMLCNHSLEELRALYPNGLTARTAFSVTNVDVLAEQIQKAKEQGYAVDDRELNVETTCYAVPLKQRGETIMAMSVSMPVFRMTDELCRNVLDLLFTAQKNIEEMLDTLPELSPSA